MGKTAFSGPVYGAKDQLVSYAGTPSSGASTALICSWVVPAYEDWVVTELLAYCSTASSGGNTLTLKSEGGSTTIAPRADAPGNGSTRAATHITATLGGSTTGNFSGAATADAGSYEGSWVPAGSTLRLLLSSCANPIANLNVSVRGYTRFRSSTRAE